MSTQFHVGQKVVCVDASYRVEAPPEGRLVGGLDGLTEGSVYTVRSVQFDRGWRETTICLCEIIRLPLSNFMGEVYEAGYRPERFRPVIERKTDISSLEAILRGARVPEIA